MKNSLFIFILLSAFTSSVLAKKTICSITINSNDEIEAAKKAISPDDFDFVELTQMGGEDWFKKSCQKKINCDVLIVSGHFGGTFFGSSQKTLSMSELENESCSSECDGILKKPKEVFLFGCNTLAGKNQDKRTPEQYRDVLIQDGFTQAQAEQVVAFRYSPIGINFSARMSHVFRNTQRIYGFNSVSPLGKYTGPMFSKYLDTVGPTNYSSYLDQIVPSPNQQMKMAFKGTSFVQEQGREFADKEAFPVCILSSQNKSISRAEKLKWVKSKLEMSSSLETLTFISDFLKTESWNKKWNQEESQIIQEIGQIPHLKTQLELVLASNAAWLKRTQLEVLELMLYLKMISADEQKEKAILLLGLNDADFNQEKMAYICGLNVKMHFDPKKINKDNWNNYFFRNAVKCILPPWPASAEIWKYIERVEQQGQN